MVKDKLNQAIEDAPGATSDNSAHSTGRVPSRDFIQTFYLKPELTDRLDVLQDTWGVGKSELIRWLLSYALAAVDQGDLKPTRERKTRVRLEDPGNEKAG